MEFNVGTDVDRNVENEEERVTGKDLKMSRKVVF